jgi:alkaline phosphatase D
MLSSKKILQVVVSCVLAVTCVQPAISQGKKVASTNIKSASLLQAGPMIGNVDFRSVKLWVQTTQPTDVAYKYWASDSPQHKKITPVIRTNATDGFTAIVELTDVQPSTAYTYQLLLNGKEVSFDYPLQFKTLPLWKWRTDAPDFTVAIGSCNYIADSTYDRPGKPYGGDYRIFNSIHAKHPDMMIWLGDNYYFREADWNTRNGMMQRATHTRSVPEIQPLLASTSHIATWDDHDYGPNDSDRGFHKKQDALEVFKLFWANAHYGFNGKPSVASKSEWSDVEFFLLDNRYYRSPNKRKTGEREIFGKEQIEWLIDNLASSFATFKIIGTGGMTVSDLARFENYATAPDERAYLLRRLAEEKIEGVIFISGDVHYAAASKMDRQDAYPLYDFTFSPLTAGATSRVDDGNSFLIPGTLYKGRNFGFVEFSGKGDTRKATFRLFDTDGKEIWNRDVFAKDLKYSSSK